ncbi:carbohydrate kinase family protein [Sphaerochaeta globosa]|uniref:Fructokinase n=1 Tax=Sphaerochaeta globosa (strain ATCC BAA-1886 / DSM 22777 / Buddy) TaxID=158189 RepID=F0RWW0_SPHGB|nr:carbohydrate kinase [Sphaerochaeta globosa]ADY13741.1 Fructokinase [Sphaerochaeta globosa str. Buddy]
MIGVIGEALVDFISQKAEGSTVSFDSHVGGCGLNAATAASLQGTSVGFMGKLSQDMFGKRILEHLVDNQVLFDPSLCAAPQPSLLAFASLDEQKKATYAFYWEGSAPVTLGKEELLAVLSEHSDLRVVHIGSLALALEPGCHAILAALRQYEPRPIIFLDPNVRPAVIADEKSYKKRIQEAFGLASIVKLSDEDLAYLYPNTDVRAQARKLAKDYSMHVILTLGREGSIWFTPEGGATSMPIVDLPVIDTVGAGDTFSGALLSYLHERDCFGSDGQTPLLGELNESLIKDALRWATAASAINCSRRGCDPPTKLEVQTLLSSQ